MVNFGISAITIVNLINPLITSLTTTPTLSLPVAGART